MPSYFFHVEFELCNPDSISDPSLALRQPSSPTTSSTSKRRIAVETETDTETETVTPDSERVESKTLTAVSTYIPQPGTDIFKSKLPNTRKKIEGRIRPLSWNSGLGENSLSHFRRGSEANKVWDGENSGDGHKILVAEQGQQIKRQEGQEKHAQVSQGTGSKTTNVRDWRFGKVSIESIDMKRTSVIEDGSGGGGKKNGGSGGNGSGSGSAEQGRGGNGAARACPATLGHFVPAETATTDVGWGVVHLYRDAKETPGLESTVANSRQKDYNRNRAAITQDASFKEKDCTTLCILAVPSYMTSSDLLGFVGERTREDVSHFRLIRTARANKYMVLMKFRDAGRAKIWQREWNGKLFNSMEPENCHVVFVKSVQFRSSAKASSFPEMINDSFTPSTSQISSGAGQPVTEGSTRTSTALSTKPLAPPTRSLVELPTCPVCLERMDETTGLLTILCQHVFHCACLEKWRGSGCPVCRYTQSAGVSSLAYNGTVINNTNNDDNHCAHDNDDDRLPENECRVCGALSNLWICLICGNTGCGRYDEAHAFAHYEATGHSYAMDIATQAVWDYAGDGYVHRLIQNKADGKLVDLPAAFSASSGGAILNNNPNGTYAANPADSVPREKIDNMAAEYTYLITSQLDSQRRYFEEQVERAVTKATTASNIAEKATSSLDMLTDQVASLQSRYDSAIASITTLESSAERQTRRAEKAEQLARNLKREWHEEKTVNESLMGRLKFLDEKVKDGESEKDELKKKVGELEEMNRDLGFFISGGERLKGLVAASSSTSTRAGTAGDATGVTPEGVADIETAGDGKAGEDGMISGKEIIEGKIELPPPTLNTAATREGAAATTGSRGRKSKNKGKKKK